MKTISFLSLALTVSLTGCVHRQPAAAKSVRPPPQLAVVPSPQEKAPVSSAAPGAPLAVAQGAHIRNLPPERTSFIVQPKYKKVYLRGYKDEKGRAVSPQEIVQEVTPGGINPEALDNWDNSYIPAQNMEIPTGMGSPVAAIAPKVVSPDADSLATQNPEDVEITGFYQERDRPVVQSIAEQKGKRAHFDSQLGWVLLKK